MLAVHAPLALREIRGQGTQPSAAAATICTAAKRQNPDGPLTMNNSNAVLGDLLLFSAIHNQSHCLLSKYVCLASS